MCVSAGDEKWLLVSTDQLYGMAQNSSDRATQSRRQHKSRLPPALSSGAASEAVQCEVAFPGNRILSLSPAEDAQPKLSCLFDVHRTDVNGDELTGDHLLSEDDHTSDKVPSQSVSDLRDVNASAADSNSLDSPTLKRSHLCETCKIAEGTDNKSADSGGIYMENGDLNAVQMEPMKTEKLATFGNYIVVVRCY